MKASGVFRRTAAAALCGVLLVGTTSCYTLHHDVGQGALRNETVAERAQWYALWGLVPILGEVDGGELAGSASDYTVRSQFTVLDVVINFFTSTVTVTRQTVTVTE